MDRLIQLQPKPHILLLTGDLSHAETEQSYQRLQDVLLLLEQKTGVLIGCSTKDLIFIDESGVNLSLVRLFARSLKGQRANAPRSQKRLMQQCEGSGCR